MKMKTLKGGLALLLCVLALTASAYSGQFIGGKGYLHTSTAISLPPGALDIGIYGRGYAGTPPGALATLYNNTSAVTMNFGFSRHAEIGLSQIIYQDLNLTPRDRSVRDVESAIPGHSALRIKFANYSFKNNFYWGVMPSLRIRTSRYNDIYLEPYQSGAMEFEMTGILSYFQKPLFPDEGYAAHLNLGYINHNDRASLQDASSEFSYLGSFVMSTIKFDYGVEMYGNVFLVEANKYVFSRENYMYVTPMFTFKVFKGLSVTGGVDILALGTEETTIHNPSKSATYLQDGWPNYPEWRITGRIAFMPSTPFYVAPTFVDVRDPGTGRERRKSAIAMDSGDEMFSRSELFRWAIEERFGDQEAVDVDLERIRMERRRAEEELNRLKAEMNAQKAQTK